MSEQPSAPDEGGKQNVKALNPIEPTKSGNLDASRLSKTRAARCPPGL